jgi:mannose-6-phosphate isomerase-like protein (cupin superfamily)
MTDAFELSNVPVHLGLGATAETLPGFAWTPEYLGAYTERTAGDGDDGRLVVAERQDASWTSWERHPAGEEVVILLSGRVDLIQEIDGEARTVALTPGMAVINPRNVWHTADVHEPGEALFITPGRGTEGRPR